jgi:hypothetical protein
MFYDLLNSEEINKSKFNTMIGLVDRERVDQELYDDFESNKVREVYFFIFFIILFRQITRSAVTLL